MLLKISPTLLDSLDWYRNCPPSWKQRAFEGIVSRLQRKPYETTKAAEKGLLFEDAVQKMAETGDIEITAPFMKQQSFYDIAAELCGFQWQQWKEAYMEVEDYGTVKMVGRLDALSDNLIVDLKTTSSFKGEHKYRKNWQHKFYCHWTGIPKFKYIVTEWENEDSLSIAQVYHIEITQPLAPAKEEIYNGIRGFFAFLKTHNLWDDYVYVYSKNER